MALRRLMGSSHSLSGVAMLSSVISTLPGAQRIAAQLGEGAMAIACDIRDDGDIENLVATTAARFEGWTAGKQRCHLHGLWYYVLSR